MDKVALRKKVRADIRNMDQDYRKISDEGIFNNLISLAEYKKAENIFAYFSVKGEADTIAFIRRAMDDGKNVYLPIVLGEGIMVFAKPEGELVDGDLYGIPEPTENSERREPSDSDIIIVPALCFDRNCYRLGQGGGYYDRYLEKHGKVFTVGLCREKLLMDEVPRESHDFGVDCVVTEKEVFKA